MPSVAPAAIEMGNDVAKEIRKRVQDYTSESRASSYRDKGAIATMGRTRVVAATGALRLSGFIAWLMWSVIHVAYLSGFLNRRFVMFSWSYLKFQKGARLITGARELKIKERELGPGTSLGPRLPSAERD